MFNEEVVISDVSLDVPLDNYEEFDHEIDSSLLGEKLLQTNTLKGTRRQFQFYKSRYLLLDILEKKKNNARKFHLDLAWLSAEPEHHKVIVWKWLLLAVFAAAIAGLFLFFSLKQILPSVYNTIGGSLSLSSALIFSLLFIYQMRDDYVFYSHYAHVRLFLLENRKPDPDAFNSFFIQLQQRIEKAQAGIPVDRRLVGELKMCRRLKDEKLIDEDSYTRARSTIFRHRQYRA